MIDIESDPILERALFDRIPVVEIGEQRFEAPLDPTQLQQAVMAQAAPKETFVEPDKSTEEIIEAAMKTSKPKATGRKRNIIVWLDKMFLGFARRWVLYISLIVGLYAGIPFLAPVAMHFGWTGVGRAIYTVYSPVCHQFAFRSWFLFGEHAAYPRARTGVPTANSFEAYASQEPFFTSIDGLDVSQLDGNLTFAAKAFQGSQRMGWKVAFCERDVAIYAAIALFGILFGILSARGVQVPVLPLWAYILIAIAPMGLDGFSQLFANPPFNGFGIAAYPIRESTPFLRTLTGSLFGIGNAWLAFPYIEESMAETRIMLADKLTRAGVLKPKSADIA